MDRSSSTSYMHHILTSLYVHRYFGGLVLSFTAVVWLASIVSEEPHRVELRMYSGLSITSFALMAAILVARRVLYLARVEKEPHPLGRLVVDLKEWIVSADGIVSLVVLLLVLPWFQSEFTCFKSIIPAMNPFRWDTWLSALDKTLHFGRLPSDWTRYCLGNIWVTFGVNFLYNMWFAVMSGFIFWQALQNRRRMLRMRFLTSYVLIWSVIGSFCAAAFSSGGPCYFGRLATSNDVYAEHMGWLHNVDTELHERGRFFGVWALNVQQRLWNSYTEARVEVGSGISAMPSMHVAMSMLMVLTAWSYGGWVRWTFLLYLAAIQIGSVHLGWHYAIDGYVSMVLTFLMWMIGGWLARRAITSPNAASHLAVAGSLATTTSQAAAV